MWIALKGVIKYFLPAPILVFLRSRSALWTGNYNSWDQAISSCYGYGAPNILLKIDQAAEQVASGQVAWERDSVVFNQVQQSWPVLCALLWSYSLSNKLNILDFGGSLGTSYYQNQKYLKHLPFIWNIVEQSHYVSLGRRKYQTDQLYFWENIQSCVDNHSPNVFLASASLQYYPDPTALLVELTKCAFDVLVFDRVQVFAGDKNRLTRQVVPEQVYRASYPCWIMHEHFLVQQLREHYDLVSEFDSYSPNNIFIDGKIESWSKGYIFRRSTLL
jgi:putative methyltransferase (TIGR04325 family)